MTTFTNVSALTAVLDIIENGTGFEGYDMNALVEKLYTMKASYEKSSSSKSAKAAEKAEQNACLAMSIYDKIKESGAMNICMIQEEVPDCAGLSSQKIVAVIKPLLQDGSLVKVKMDGKIAYATKDSNVVTE